METASTKLTGSTVLKDSCACSTEENIHTACSIFGSTVAGLGVGVVSGISLVVLAAAAEVAVPAILVLKAFGLTGGAFGFLKGIKKD
ncbi:MAG TPA: hypothetical protein HPP94_07190 [Desulfuromonadales bacterium]|nr:hypothetical protein [Desulfuromonadales bacterium]